MDDEGIREAARQRRIADACMGSDVATGRLGLYRRLIQGNLATVARRLLPRTVDHLDRAGSGAFDGWFARFLAEAGPRTPYLRDVPGEFVAWAAPLWALTAQPPAFLGDLARHEIDRFIVEWAPGAGSQPALGEVAIDRPLVFATARRLARYEHAVHEIEGTPAARATFVLLHRDEENTVHVTDVEPGMAELLGHLLAGVPVVDALARAAATDEREGRVKPRLVELAGWLARLGESGALLGGER